MSVAGAVKPTLANKDRAPTNSRTEPPSSPQGDRPDGRSPSPDSRRPPAVDDDSARKPASNSEAGESEDDKESESSKKAIIDMEAFGQILDLDEDETHDFSQEMVTEYFTQATQTFADLEKALQEKDLEKLSSLGHFLKGSSATLGVSAVQSTCEKIQNYGHLTDGAGGTLDSKDALDKITDLMGNVKKDYTVAEKWLRQWYKDHGAEIS
ncbi:Phosphorelay intermediate protein [Marasmius sp. AFHP31]|nr:Phosphorelay intermediate protein [Marasmius sp. AFHP31]